jgi:urease accessory protein
MGTPATRITAADFITPPELRNWQLAPNGAGRIGGLRIDLVQNEGKTALGGCYQQVPLRLLPPFQLGAHQPALFFLLNPTAGLMDGDAQGIEIQAGPGTQAVIVGQSATRIHPAVQGFCTQQWKIRVSENATLVVLPGPAIPFQGCRYFQRVSVELASTAILVWGDIWLAGRYARGSISELFQFESIIQEMEIRREGYLIFRDRFSWQGPWDEVSSQWHFGSCTAAGSLFSTGIADLDLPKQCCHSSRSQTASGDSCFRWQGLSEGVTSRVVKTALECASNQTDLKTPWLHWANLAPCHWFSGASRL